MKHAATLGCGLLMLASLTSYHASAQTFSNEQLLDNARSAGQNRQWVNAYGFLYAYVQRDAPEMSDPGFRRKINEAVQAAFWNANNAGPGGGGGGETAGVSGKGDSFEKSARGNAKAFSLPAGPGRPQSYRLRCEGGGAMSARYRAAGETAILSVSFGRAPNAATTRYPGPGRCAWLDRPLRDNEPAQLEWRFSSRERGISQFAFGGRDWAADRGLAVSGGRIPALAEEIHGRELEVLVSKVRMGGIFDVMCYNDGRGRLVVTHVY